MGKRRIMEGMNKTRIHCKHTEKCHNETPYITIIYLKKHFLKRQMKMEKMHKVARSHGYNIGEKEFHSEKPPKIYRKVPLSLRISVNL
jgi:hypothetical protein